MVVFDKTGTLTEGRPALLPRRRTEADLLAAAGIARASRHPLARALVAAAPHAISPSRASRSCPGWACAGVRPQASGASDGATGRRVCTDDEAAGAGSGWRGRARRPSASASRTRRAPTRRRSSEVLGDGAIRVALLSGDRVATVRAVAAEVGIADWHGGCAPADKVARLEAWAAEGRRVLMVGDGLNDAPALAAAYVSLSPATAVDVAQTAADAVFQGALLRPVLEVIQVARRAERLVKQNIGLSLAYNLLAVPLAMLGYVTPLIAAVAMSSSSILVVLNSTRLACAVAADRHGGLLYLIPIALFLGLLGLAAFMWAMRSGQFDDLDGAAERILFDDEDDGRRGYADGRTSRAGKKRPCPRLVCATVLVREVRSWLPIPSSSPSSSSISG